MTLYLKRFLSTEKVVAGKLAHTEHWITMPILKYRARVSAKRLRTSLFYQ
jgi:hypothetical protein